jgi:hypothetical protein
LIGRSPRATTGRIVENEPAIATGAPIAASSTASRTQPHGDAIELADVAVALHRIEQKRACGEGVGGDDFGAGPQVIAMNGADHVGMRDIGFGAPDLVMHRHAAALDLRSGTTIENDVFPGHQLLFDKGVHSTL